MIHSMYTRQRYDDEGELDYRMELALQTSIPSMVEAARLAPHPVRWVWAAHERDHARIYQDLLDAGWSGEIVLQDDFPPQQLPDDELSSTLDSDDRVASHYLRRMQRQWKPATKPYIIFWQPLKQRLEDGQLFQHRMRYSETRPSPFYAIYNPDDRAYVYAKKHGKMHLCGARVEMSRDLRAAIAVIHGKNKLMDIKSGDRPIDRSARSRRDRQRRRRRRGKGKQ